MTNISGNLDEIQPLEQTWFEWAQEHSFHSAELLFINAVEFKNNADQFISNYDSDGYKRIGLGLLSITAGSIILLTNIFKK